MTANGKLSLPDMIVEVHELTHLPEIEILEAIYEQWPTRHDEFSTSQAKLLAQLMQRRASETKSYRPRPVLIPRR